MADMALNMNSKGIKSDGSSYRVLVVDDSSTMRKILISILKSEQYDVCGEAGDGDQAFEMYKELKPDIITLDINMPKVSGVEVLQKVMAYDPSAKIVMLTSEGQKETLNEAIRMGAKSYVVKPPEKDDLLNKVEEVLKN